VNITWMGKSEIEPYTKRTEVGGPRPIQNFLFVDQKRIKTKDRERNAHELFSENKLSN
jgi:hypothetical protein